MNKYKHTGLESLTLKPSGKIKTVVQKRGQRQCRITMKRTYRTYYYLAEINSTKTLQSNILPVCTGDLVLTAFPAVKYRETHTSSPPYDVNLRLSTSVGILTPPPFLQSPYHSHHTEGHPHSWAISCPWRSFKNRFAFLFIYDQRCTLSNIPFSQLGSAQ